MQVFLSQLMKITSGFYWEENIWLFSSANHNPSKNIIRHKTHSQLFNAQFNSLYVQKD